MTLTDLTPRDEAAQPPSDGARRRRPLLIGLAVSGLLLGALGMTGVFSAVIDRATSGLNEVETGELVQPPPPGPVVDLKIATYDAATQSCGAFTDHLATGLNSTDSPATVEAGLTLGTSAQFCLRNDGSAAGVVTLGVIDLVDTEVSCAPGEDQFDQTCAAGAAGELSPAVEVLPGVSLASLQQQPAPTGITLQPAQVIDAISIDLKISTQELERIQTDAAQWRWAFDLHEQTPGTPCAPSGNNSLQAAADYIEPVSGAICTNEVDWYRFSNANTVPVTVTLTFSHEAGDLDLFLTDAQGTQIAASEGVVSNETITFTPQGNPGDPYYVKVVGFNGAANSYTLTIQQ